MTSTFTTNKGIEKPASGDYVNAWAAPINADWDDIDTALGGVTPISVTGIAAGIHALTLTQYRPPNIEFTGVLTANLNYQIPAGIGGMWTLNNATTGAFTLQFSINAGNVISLPANRTLIVSDGSTIAIADSATAATAQANAIATSEASAAALYAPQSNGSFTATCPDISGSPTITVFWARSGPIVTIYTISLFPSGTSISNQLHLTGMPGSITPVRLQANFSPVIGCTDNFTNTTAVIAIDSSGNINFNRVVGNTTTGWTASGAKEGPPFFCFTYSVV